MVFPQAKFVLSVLASGLLLSCSGINDSWEINGGGYLKYKINGEGPFTIELHEKDVETPYYNRSYFYVLTRLSESNRGDQISLLVNRPSTNGKLTPASRASINNKYEDVTWMRIENSNVEAPLVGDSSYIHFDEIITDSLYTADIELYFTDCRGGFCVDSLPPVHLSGRLRYWLPDDAR